MYTKPITEPVTYGQELEQQQAEKAEAQRQQSLANRFDSRSEVSADARHIVKHLWIIAFFLPAAAAVAVWILKSAS